MNPDLKTFIFSVLRVMLAAALVVAVTAFLSMPYTLGHHPGEPAGSAPAFARHMS